MRCYLLRRAAEALDHGTGPDGVHVLSSCRAVRRDSAAWHAMILPHASSYRDIRIVPDGTVFLVGLSGAAGIEVR